MNLLERAQIEVLRSKLMILANRDLPVGLEVVDCQFTFDSFGDRVMICLTTNKGTDTFCRQFGAGVDMAENELKMRIVEAIEGLRNTLKSRFDTYGLGRV